MILIAEIIIMAVLVTSLIIIILEEGRRKKSKIPTAAIKEYWDGAERRQALRINSSFTVRYNVEKNYHIKLNGHMKNISSGGMQLLANEKLVLGARLFLEFDLPELKNVVCAEGKVVWADGDFTERDEIGRRTFQTGIQFVNIKPNSKKKLVAYIEKHSERV